MGSDCGLAGCRSHAEVVIATALNCEWLAGELWQSLRYTHFENVILECRREY